MQNRLESSHRLNRCGRLPNKKSKLGGCPMPDGNIYQVRSCTIFMGIFPIHDSHNIWGAETAVNELNCCHSLFLQQGCRNSHKRTTQKSILLSSLDQHLNLAISLVFSLQHGSRKKGFSEEGNQDGPLIISILPCQVRSPEHHTYLFEFSSQCTPFQTQCVMCFCCNLISGTPAWSCHGFTAVNNFQRLWSGPGFSNGLGHRGWTSQSVRMLLILHFTDQLLRNCAPTIN